MATEGTNLLQLARQGNIEALHTLLSQKLQPKGINVELHLEGALLQINLESEQAPCEAKLVEFLRNGLSRLQPNSISRVRIYGKRRDINFPVWVQEIELQRVTLSRSDSERYSVQIPNRNEIEYIKSLFKKGVEKSEGNNQEAIELFSQIVSLDPTRSEAFFMRASNKLALHDYSNAIDDFNKSIEIQPNHGQAYYERAMALYALNNYQESIKDYTRANQLGVSYVSLYNNRGVAYEHIGEYRKAIEDFSVAISLDSSSEMYYRNRALAYEKLGNKASSEEDLLKADKLSGKESQELKRDLVTAGTAVAFSFPILMTLLNIPVALFMLFIALAMMPVAGWVLIGITALILFSYAKSTVP